MRRRERFPCPYEGCVSPPFLSERARDRHVALAHVRCWCGKVVVSLAKHLYQSDRRGLKHPPRPDGWEAVDHPC